MSGEVEERRGKVKFLPVQESFVEVGVIVLRVESALYTGDSENDNLLRGRGRILFA